MQSDADNLSMAKLGILDPILRFTGTQVNYYFVCKRKLWFFSHNMELESDSDLVLLGKLLHEHSYNRKLKEVEVGRIKIDFIERTDEIHEIKRSRKIENAHLYQLLYYIYFIKKVTGKVMRGVLNYPLLKKRVNVELTQEKEIEIANLLIDLQNIISMERPPEAHWINYCKSCAYRELCWG